MLTTRLRATGRDGRFDTISPLCGASHDLTLDGDVILAAQARDLAQLDSVVVATTNVKHLVCYVDARVWSEV